MVIKKPKIKCLQNAPTLGIDTVEFNFRFLGAKFSLWSISGINRFIIFGRINDLLIIGNDDDVLFLFLLVVLVTAVTAEDQLLARQMNQSWISGYVAKGSRQLGVWEGERDN